jgi:hypothetical protein
MGEVIRFIPKSERERVRLIREARAIYDSIFPPSVSSRKGYRQVAIANTLQPHISYTNEHTSLISGRGKRSNKPAGSP